MASTVIELHRSQGRSMEDARELSQKALVDLVKKLERAPDDPEAFRKFVVGFAMKATQQQSTATRRYENKRAAIRAQPRTPARRPDSWLVIRRLLEFVMAELRKLPSPFRSTFDLALRRDKHSEVAEELGVPVKTVQRRVWRARRMLESAMRRARVLPS